MAKASSKKNTASQSRSTGKKQSAKTQAAKRTRKPDKRTIAKKKKKLREEVSVILTSFLGILLFFSNLGLFGRIGGALASVQKGLFGTAAYVVPILVIAAAVLYVKNQEHFMAPLKLLCSLLNILILGGLSDLMFAEERGLSFFDKYAVSSEGALGGGAVGGAISEALISLCGMVGAYIILIFIFIICMVVITERSFVGAARQSAERTLNAAKAGKERYDAIHEERLIRRRAEREKEELRKKEMSFPDLRGMESSEMADKADIYARYGRDIIEGAASETEDPLADDIHQGSRRNFEAQGPVMDYDYEADTVPFEEDREERYRSYAHITGRGDAFGMGETEEPGDSYPGDGGELGLADARNHGYAVGYNEDHRNEPELFEPESVTAFRPAEDGVRAEGPGEEDIYPEDMGYDTGEADGYEAALTDNADKSSMESAAPDGMTGGSVTSSEDSEVVLSAYGKELPPVSRYERDKVLKDKLKKSQEQAEAGGASEGGDTEVSLEGRNVSGMEGVKAGGASPSSANKAADASRTSGAAKPAKPAKPKKPYRFPPINLLLQRQNSAGSDNTELAAMARKLESVLKTFGVGVSVKNFTRGPSVTRYEMVPDTGVSVSKITSRLDDIKLTLAASDVRLEAPIPGKAAVGIEVPNRHSSTVYLRELIASKEFRTASSKLTFAIGRDIQGRIMLGDIAKMPHLLIAGTTGSGKSVGINALILSLIYKAAPEDVRMIMIDPKIVELSPYNGIPHLLIPVVTEAKKAVSTLNWAVNEMKDRYEKFREARTKNLEGYNEKIEQLRRRFIEEGDQESLEKLPGKMPQIVIIIDELAELMMSADREINSKDVEGYIASLAQAARAAGMHLVIATQRPSVNVITGVIKANIPSRIAYKASSAIDSRTILDMAGAESLIGHGDMLYMPVGASQPVRIQGAFVSEDEIEKVVAFVSKDGASGYEESVENSIVRQQKLDFSGGEASVVQGDDRDGLFYDAGELITDMGKASIGMLQRKFKIGFNRAARIMDQLCEAGVVGEEEGTKPRRILMTREQYREFMEKGGTDA